MTVTGQRNKVHGFVFVLGLQLPRSTGILLVSGRPVTACARKPELPCASVQVFHANQGPMSKPGRATAGLSVAILAPVA